MCMFMNIVQGGQEEADFAAKNGISVAKRYVCLDPIPEYGVKSIPHVTVIHSSGMVVRNGPPGSAGFPDAIEPLVQAMVDESGAAGEQVAPKVEESVTTTAFACTLM
mmetsp:Transcript_64251/g.168195  ORF Transcript_64251/g.168195 Transcript_64251/m.168195 type:complete len:107 (-) Transcript_64251:56-376(-)